MSLVGCPGTCGKSGPTHPPHHNPHSPWPNSQAALALFLEVLLPAQSCLLSLRLLTVNVPFSLFLDQNPTELPRSFLWLFTGFFLCPRGGCGQSCVQDVGLSYTFSQEWTSEPSDMRIEKWYQWPSEKTLLSFLLCRSLIQHCLGSLALPWPDALPLFLSL